MWIEQDSQKVGVSTFDKNRIIYNRLIIYKQHTINMGKIQKKIKTKLLFLASILNIYFYSVQKI